MWRTSQFFLLIGIIGACADPIQKDDLIVLTYNIRHGEGTDGVFDLDRQARVILDSGADLVALQEVDVCTTRASGINQAEELARLTGMNVLFGEAIPYAGGSYGDAVLSKYPIESEMIWKLPAEPHHEDRVAVGILVTLPSGENVRFIGTHLDHTRDPSDRIRQARSIIEQAFPVGKQIPPTLLLGDLNAEPDSEPMRALLEFFDSAAPGGLPSFPSDKPSKAIDWVLYAPTDSWEILEVHTIDEPVASDHTPLRAVLRHKPPH
ncbi:MAG: endonuclease/exonuclease/phosphatase family protein [Planctomycetes bacterium]|nr:endonuclease/exonuclease/phosphatase family protein [Planctomycetota bacterium]